jgi:hypothetical protein
VLVHADVPSEFLEHLDRCGLPVARVLRHPELDPRTILRPFGWSAEAIGLNRLHDRPADHPDPQTIERVNSRSLALAIETESCGGAVSGRIVRDPRELESFLSSASAGGEWIVKAEHGNSGLANRRLREGRMTEADRRFVDGVFAEDDGLLVEPWLDRTRDWCSVFDVPFDAASLRIHEATCTRDGALIGSLFEPGGAAEAPQAELARTAEVVARRLTEEGYIGPVCVDAFHWRGAGGRTELRTLADLNCRLSMSDWAHRAWRRLAPDRTCFYRFFNRRKLDLPAGLAALPDALGDRAYDRSSRRGILPVSPLEFGKLAFLFVAAGRRDVFELEAWFRERFETR